MSDPVYIAFSLGLGAVLLIGYVVLLCRQYLELRRLKSGITFYRWSLFTVYLLSVLTIVPVLMYRLLRVMGIDSVVLANVTAILSPINALIALIIILIFTFGKINLEEDK